MENKANNMERQQQEYEYVMEGITTRMQIALEKQSASVRWVCIVMLVTVLLIIAGFIVNNVIMINHINDIRSGVSAYETVLEQRPGADD